MYGLGWLKRRRVRREQAAVDQYRAAMALASTSNYGVLRVLTVYQRAQRGTKVVVRFADAPYTHDAWLWWASAHPGDLLVVRWSSGWGEHTHRDGVVYIGSPNGSGVIHHVSHQVMTLVDQHYARIPRAT